MPETGVTLRFRMEGYEAIQDQLEEIDDTEDQIIEKTKEVEAKVTRSMSAIMASVSIVVRVGMDVLDVFGITIDTIHKEIINMILSYAQQLTLIAVSSSGINPAYAAAVATVAMTLQARAIQLQAAGDKDAKEAMDNARRLMRDVSSSMVILTRT